MPRSIQALAIIILGLKRASKRMRLLLYPEGNPFTVRIFTDQFRDLPVDARLRINRHMELVIRPSVDVEEKRLALLPDVGMDCRRQPGQHRRTKVDGCLIGIPGIQG